MKKIKSILTQKETYILLALWLIVLSVNYLPYLKRGISGNVIDMIYQLERIEGLKDSIKAGVLIPRIYERFFYGYGYGTPLFYSDFYFVVPAVLRIIGFSATQAVKLFILFIVSANFFTSFACFKAVFKRFDSAVLGTCLLTLSQYYLMDLSLRIGLGEYIAAIFVPVLFLAIYDYFANEGKRVYLFGVAFGGMLLAHTIMVFLGAIITVFAFVIAFISRKYRKKVFVKKKIIGLCITAFATFTTTAYYFIPMLEQMASGKFGFNNPWTYIGDFVPDFLTIFYPKGSMFFVCEGGIGVAIWATVIYGLVMFFILKKNENMSAEGLVLIVLGVIMSIWLTNVFPWKVFNNTLLNSIQFTFRFLPYVLNLMVFGGVCIWSKDENNLRRKITLVVLLILSVGFGFYQNYGVEVDEATYTLDEEFLTGSGTLYVGRGEWMPEVLEVEAFLQRLATEPEMISRLNSVEFETGATTAFERLGGNLYSFEISGDNENAGIPLIYYKGYSACVKTGNGKHYLTVRADEEGFIEVVNDSASEGTVYLSYSGTAAQKISVLLTLVSILSIVGMTVYRKVKKNKA